MEYSITEARLPAEFEQAGELLREYVADLGLDLSFQQFEAELGRLHEMYSRPEGVMLLAQTAAGETAGCVAVRRIDDRTAELKRMFIRPVFRGQGLARPLLQQAIGMARTLGYQALRLDTLPSMSAAIALYRTFGFEEIEAYRFNPIQGALFFELKL